MQFGSVQIVECSVHITSFFIYEQTQVRANIKAQQSIGMEWLGWSQAFRMSDLRSAFQCGGKYPFTYLECAQYCLPVLFNPLQNDV